MTVLLAVLLEEDIYSLFSSALVAGINGLGNEAMHLWIKLNEY